MKPPKFFGKASVLSVIMTVAMVFVTAVLIYSAVTQFKAGQWFSGCVSILGAVLTSIISLMLLNDFKKRQKNKQQKKA